MVGTRTPRAVGRGRIPWIVATSTGLTATLVAGVMVAPPSRRNDGVPPDLAWGVGVPCWVVAVVLLVVLVVVPIPSSLRGDGAAAGQVCAIVVGILLTGFLVWRLVVGADDDRGFTPEQVGLAVPGLGVLLALLAAFGMRCRRASAPDRIRRAEQRARAEARRRRTSHLRRRR